MKSTLKVALCLLPLCLPAAAPALDLVGAWQAAQDHDLDLASARAARQAGAAHRAQGRALWRPSLSAVGDVGRMDASTQVAGAHFSAPGFGQTNAVAFDTSVNGGTSASWSLVARQPLLNGSRLAQSRELEMSADLAEAQWESARQAAMLQTAERYFAVVVAQEALRVLQDQQAAVQQALAQAQERYRLGDIPITDSHEATARSEEVRARIIAAETDLQMKRLALSDATGIAPEALALKVPGTVAPQAGLAPLQDWLASSGTNNPDVVAQSAGLAMAEQDVQRYRAVASPSLDLVARLGRDHLSGTGDFGAASNTATSGIIGLEITIPLFTGGYRSAQHEEALGLADKARADEGRKRQQVALQTRSAWLGLTSGQARVDALAAARRASFARLEATRLGQQVGDRSTLDLLNAQSDAATADLALLQARIALIMDRLRLAALAGRLDDEQLHSIAAGAESGDPAPGG